TPPQATSRSSARTTPPTTRRATMGDEEDDRVGFLATGGAFWVALAGAGAAPLRVRGVVGTLRGADWSACGLTRVGPESSLSTETPSRTSTTGTGVGGLDLAPLLPAGAGAGLAGAGAGFSSGAGAVLAGVAGFSSGAGEPTRNTCWQAVQWTIWPRTS